MRPKRIVRYSIRLLLVGTILAALLTSAIAAQEMKNCARCTGCLMGGHPIHCCEIWTDVGWAACWATGDECTEYGEFCVRAT